MLKDNYLEVEKRVDAACRRAGRDRSEVTLVAVGKTKPIEMLREAYSAGARDFGENKVQEICEKFGGLPADAKWHMIGHLQRNKVRQIIDKVCMIHSVDSYRLAQEISVQAQKAGITIPVLIEVNIAGEESKFGVQPAETAQLAEEIAVLPKIHVAGLMAVAPFVDDPEENRIYFRQMKQLSVDTKNKNIDNVDMGVLSMGMTGDFEVAIEEGSTMVRIGTAIFGERKYQRSE